jgi:hypothetical protein
MKNAEIQQQNPGQKSSWWRRMIGIVAGAIGTAIAGPVGGAIALAVAEYFLKQKSVGPDVPEHFKVDYENWIQTKVTPFISDLSGKLSGSGYDYIQPPYIFEFNKALKELAIIQAYYEFRSKNATRQDLKDLFLAQAHLIGGNKDIFIQVYEAETEIYNSPYVRTIKKTRAEQEYGFGSISFDWQNSNLVFVNYPVFIHQDVFSRSSSKQDPVHILPPQAVNPSNAKVYPSLPQESKPTYTAEPTVSILTPAQTLETPTPGIKSKTEIKKIYPWLIAAIAGYLILKK